jgi:hypothetical protein
MRHLITTAILIVSACSSVAASAQEFRGIERPAIAKNLQINLTRPQIALVNATAPAVGRQQGFVIKLSGMKGWRAAHVYRFTPGCDFERQLGVAGQRVTFDRRLANSELGYTSDVPGVNNLVAPTREGIALDANGEAMFRIEGVVGVSGGTNAAAQDAAPAAAVLQNRTALLSFSRTVVDRGTSCTPRAIIVFQGENLQWHTVDRSNSVRAVATLPQSEFVEVQGPAWTPLQRRRVVISDTASLRGLLNPQLLTAATFSQCSGTSSALGQPDFPVGVRTVSGDIAFSISSGPTGTRCRAVLDKGTLPAGVTALSATFSTNRRGVRCQLGSQSLLPTDLVRAWLTFTGVSSVALDRIANVVRPPAAIAEGAVRDIGGNGWLDPFRFPEDPIRVEWQAQTAPMTGVLECAVTAVNDHGVTLRLDSMEFLVPEGVNLP